MENIKMYEDFDINEHIEDREDKILSVPYSVIQHWRDEIGFDPEHAADLMTDFLDNYYDNKIDAADPDEIAKKYMEDIETEEDMTGAAADEDPTLIKKFEE